MVVNNFSNPTQPFEYGMEFWSNTNELLNMLERSGETTSLNFVSIVLPQLTVQVIIITLLTAFNIIIVIPANVIEAAVIIKNKDLWTCSNVVLAINAIAQATGSLIFLVVRWPSLGILPFFDQSWARVFFPICWWTCFIMMRTGNNRLVTSSEVFC